MFWQKIKKGLLLFVVSVGLVLSVATVAGFPQRVYAVDPPAAPVAKPEDESSTAKAISAGLNTAGAAIINTVLLTAIKIIAKFMELMGYLFSFVIEALKVVLSYRGYATQREVSSAWSITRDLINSFFIVVLIAIAISTIIRFQQYNFRSTLPRLILAAFLVNFSKTICLLAISFADTVMQTFVTALTEILPVYAIGLRLPALTAFDGASIGGLFTLPSAGTLTKPPVEILTLLISAIMGAIMLVFALGGIVMFLIILLFRIIVLWFLIILSPLAFFLWGVPGRASSYWGQWLEEFVKHLIIGPIGAFFLYIIAAFYVTNIKGTYGLTMSSNLAVPALTQGVTPNILIGYLVSLGMMFIALEIVEQMGVRGGHFARDIGIEGIAAPFARGLKTIATGAPGVVGDFITSKTGIPLSPTRALEGIKGGLAAKRYQLAKEAVIKTSKTAGKLAERGSFLTPAYAYATGNEDLIKSIGIKDMFSFSKSLVPGGLTQEGKFSETLKSDYEQGKNHTGVVQKFNSMDNVLKSFIGNKTQDQLINAMNTQVAQHKSYQEAKASMPDLQARFNAGDVTVAPALLEANRLVAEYEDDVDAAEIANRDHVVANEKAIQEFQDGLNKTGVQLESGEALGSFADRTSKKNIAIEAKQTADMNELKRRQKFASLAVAGARSDLTTKVQDYIKDTYIRDIKYDAEDIYSNSLTNRDPKKREAFAGDLIKAAENGKFDDVLLKYGYTADLGGVQSFVKEVLTSKETGGLGFDEQQALTIVAEIQGRNAAAGKISQSSYVQLDGITKDFTLNPTKHHEAVVKGVKNKGAYETLRSAKRDGLGHKDAAGKWVMHEGAVEGLKSAGLKTLLKNRNLMTQIDANTKEMLIQHADKLDLDADDVTRIRESTK